MANKTEKYTKQLITLRSYLQGKNYYKALEALELGLELATGYRKDGVTPEYQHSIELCLHIMTLKQVVYEEETHCAALLHDLREDYNLTDFFIRSKFGDKVADAVEKLSKVVHGEKKDMKTYFAEIATCQIASLIKAVDRINNLNSMIGVFTIKKQREYLEEVDEYFIPMLKKVRNKFPQQSLTFYSLLLSIRQSFNSISAYVSLAESIENKENVTNKENVERKEIKTVKKRMKS